MKKEVLKEVRARPVSSLKIGKANRNRLLLWVDSTQVDSLPKNRKQLSNWYEKRAQRVTIGRVMKCIEDTSLRSFSSPWKTLVDPGYIAAFKAALRSECGLTEEDWLYLQSNEQAEVALVKRIALHSRQRLRRQSVLVLGSIFSSKAFDRLQCYFSKDATEITIGELLAKDPADWSSGRIHSVVDHVLNYDHDYRSDVSHSVRMARAFLEMLGFRYKDGAFFQSGTLRREIEIFREELGVSRDIALRCINLAQKRDLGRRFLEP